MAITTLDQLANALPGQSEPIVKNALAGTFAVSNYISLWTATGNPGQGAAQGSAAGAVPNSGTPGAVVFTNPASGNSYVARASMASNIQGMLIMYDRLAHGSALNGTLTTAQTINSPALTRPNGSGQAAEMFVEIYSALGATPANATVSYTNQSALAGQTSGAAAIPANAPAGLMIPIPFAAGDTGVQLIASLTLSASTGTAGNFGYTILRRLAQYACMLSQVPDIQDAFRSGLAQIYNSACIAFMFVLGAGTAAPGINGLFNIAQG